MSKKVADVLVASLVANDVRRVYGVVGDSLNGIANSIRESNGVIEWVGVRHEETAAFAAGAEAHLTGGLGVCAGSCGPGNTHLLNGLYECHRSRLPVIAIAAQIPSREMGSGYFQETHPEIIFKECSDYCEVVSHPEQMPRILEIAMRTAISKRGVGVVVIPGDIALLDSASDRLLVKIQRSRSILRPCEGEINEAAVILNNASKVTILGGAGCEGAHEELIQVAGILQSPIVHALRGKEFIEYDNPYDVGMTGLLGFSSGYYSMMNSDVLLVLGSDFPYQQFYPKDAKVVQVDNRGEQIGRRTKVDLALVGDVKETLLALNPNLSQKKDNSHLETSIRHYRNTRADLDSLAKGDPGKKPIHPQYVMRVLDELAASDAIFACDVGTPTLWAARYLKMNGERRLIGSFTHGSMAGALPQAIGAQEAFKDRQVISLSGDGGLSMLMGDFFTLRQQKLAVKVIVFSNSALDFVELEMKAAGFLEYGTSLENPNFAGIAEASGVLGLRVDSPEQLAPSITKALEEKGPALVEVIVNRQELLIPPSISIGEIKGFALYMAKAVLNGKGDEVVDLARTNLFR